MAILFFLPVNNDLHEAKSNWGFWERFFSHFKKDMSKKIILTELCCPKIHNLKLNRNETLLGDKAYEVVVQVN